MIDKLWSTLGYMLTGFLILLSFIVVTLIVGPFSLFWLMFIILVGILADKRGRSVPGWLLLGAFLITPLFASLFLLALGKKDQ